MTDRPVRLALAVATGAAAAMTAYAAQRAYQVLVAGEADPATVFVRIHLAYFWRAWTSAFIGGMAALVVLFAARDTARLARALTWALPAAAALLAVQAVLFP